MSLHPTVRNPIHFHECTETICSPISLNSTALSSNLIQALHGFSQLLQINAHIFPSNTPVCRLSKSFSTYLRLCLQV